MRADAEEPKQRVWVETNYLLERLQEDRFDRLVPEGQSSGSGSQLQILQEFDREEDKMITAEASGTQQWRIEVDRMRRSIRLKNTFEFFFVRG